MSAQVRLLVLRTSGYWHTSEATRVARRLACITLHDVNYTYSTSTELVNAVVPYVIKAPDNPDFWKGCGGASLCIQRGECSCYRYADQSVLACSLTESVHIPASSANYVLLGKHSSDGAVLWQRTTQKLVLANIEEVDNDTFDMKMTMMNTMPKLQ